MEMCSGVVKEGLPASYGGARGISPAQDWRGRRNRRYGNAVTGSTPEALAAYEHAVRAFNIYRGDPVALIEAAVRGKQYDVARALANERLNLKPHSPVNRQYCVRSIPDAVSRSRAA
jgi:hypothetical protein